MGSDNFRYSAKRIDWIQRHLDVQTRRRQQRRRLRCHPLDVSQRHNANFGVRDRVGFELEIPALVPPCGVQRIKRFPTTVGSHIGDIGFILLSRARAVMYPFWPLVLESRKVGRSPLRSHSVQISFRATRYASDPIDISTSADIHISNIARSCLLLLSNHDFGFALFYCLLFDLSLS